MQKLPVSWDCSSIQQFSSHTYALCNLVGRENSCLLHTFLISQTGIFSPAEDDVVTARSLGAWESVVILQHPRAGSSWPGCGWWSNLVRTCYNILGDQDGDISSNTEQQPGMLRFPGRQVPEFIFPVIFPPSSHQLGSHT